MAHSDPGKEQAIARALAILTEHFPTVYINVVHVDEGKIHTRIASHADGTTTNSLQTTYQTERGT